MSCCFDLFPKWNESSSQVFMEASIVIKWSMEVSEDFIFSLLKRAVNISQWLYSLQVYSLIRRELQHCRQISSQRDLNDKWIGSSNNQSLTSIVCPGNTMSSDFNSKWLNLNLYMLFNRVHKLEFIGWHSSFSRHTTAFIKCFWN